MRGLNMGVNTYNALIQGSTLYHPYGGRIYFCIVPGIRAPDGELQTPALRECAWLLSGCE